MAFASHARMLTETNLKRHAEEAMEQARLSDVGSAAGLCEKAEVYGPRMEVMFTGPADKVADLVRRSAGLGIRFEEIGAVQGEEHERLSKLLGELAEVRKC